MLKSQFKGVSFVQVFEPNSKQMFLLNLLDLTTKISGQQNKS